MSTDSRTFPFSAAEGASIAAKILAAGGPAIDPSQPSGEAVSHGVHLAWTIADGRITVTLVSHPWVMAEALVWVQVNKLFIGAMG